MSPFGSKAQMRYMFSAEKRGEIKKGTAQEFADATPSIKSLPERVTKPAKPKRPKPKRKS